MRVNNSLGIVAALVLVTGCHQGNAPQTATAQDIEAAKQEAQREVAQARAEASKDIKSAAKVTGSDSRVITEAKVTGSYDVAMVKADGDHKVATEKCLTLQSDMQQACKTQADADYETAAATAKATRLAKRQ
jgi:protein involved in sex pheromone biosynthesis